MNQRAKEPSSVSPSASLLHLLRAFVPDRRLTTSEARRIAEQQAQRLLHHFGIEDGPIPDALFLELPRISVQHIAKLPTSGCSFWDDDRHQWIVQINAYEPATRQRFTLFHEYKHILDHGRTVQLYGCGPNAAAQAEQTADYFAGCVLIPRPLLKRAWANGIQTQSALADYFEVSIPAISVRLAQTGLDGPHARCAAEPRDLPRKWAGRYFRAVHPTCVSIGAS